MKRVSRSDGDIEKGFSEVKMSDYPELKEAENEVKAGLILLLLLFSVVVGLVSYWFVNVLLVFMS